MERYCRLCKDLLIQRRDEETRHFLARTSCGSRGCIGKRENKSVDLLVAGAMCRECQKHPAKTDSNFCSEKCLTRYYSSRELHATVTCVKCSRVATHGKFCQIHGE